MELFKLLGTIAIDNAKANREIDTTTGRVEKSESKISSTFKKIGTAIATGFALDKAKDFGIACINASANAEALTSQFTQVFGKLENKASKNLDKIADNAGMSTNRVKGSYTQIAAFAKTTGMQTKESLALADRALVAVADSSAFYDRSLEETTESLQSFLKGNYENDAALGLSCTETTRNATANKLYGKSFQELSESQKQLTLMQMVEDANKTSGALGQAARESDTWSNQTGNLKQAFTDFQATLGKPILKRAIGWVKSLANMVQKTTKDFKAGKSPLNKFADGIKGLGKWISDCAGKINKFILNLTGCKDNSELAKKAMNLFDDSISKVAGTAEDLFGILEDVGKWFSKNPAAIKAVITVMGALVGRMIAYKAAIAAANAVKKIEAVLQAASLLKAKLQIAHLALQEGATLKAALAQAELNTVMGMNPIMLVVSAIGLLVGALATMAITTRTDSQLQEDSAAKYSKKTQAIIDQNKAIKENQKQTEKNMTSVDGEMDRVSQLTDELFGLADASGNVKKKDKSRAEFILGQLNEALGTEYKMTGNQINQYDKLTKSVKKAIRQKRAELLLQAYEQSYTEALQNRAVAQKKLSETSKDLTKKQKALKEADDAVLKAKKEFDDVSSKNYKSNYDMAAATAKYSKKLQDARDKQKQANEAVKDAQKAYSETKNSAETYYGQIVKYESAMTESMKGNYSKCKKLLEKSDDEFMVFGKQITQGIAQGVSDKNATNTLNNSIKKIVSDGLKAAQKEADVHSPSRKFDKIIGQNITLGIAQGITKKAKTVTTALTSLTQSALSSTQKAMSSIDLTKWGTVATEMNKSITATTNIDYNSNIEKIDSSSSRSVQSKQNNNDAVVEAINNLQNNMYAIFVNALKDGVSIEFDNREVARVVKKYA